MKEKANYPKNNNNKKNKVDLFLAFRRKVKNCPQGKAMTFKKAYLK